MFRDEDLAFYERVIRTREDQIKRNIDYGVNKTLELRRLNEEMAELVRMKDQLSEELRRKQDLVNKDNALRDKRIADWLQEMETTKKSRSKVESFVGLRGDNLLNCLIAIRSLADKLRTNKYEPLVNLISGEILLMDFKN